MIATHKTTYINKSPSQTLLQRFDTSEWCLKKNSQLKSYATSISPDVIGGLKIAGVRRVGDVLDLTLHGGHLGEIYTGMISVTAENNESTTFEFVTRIRGSSKDQVSADDGIVIVLPVISIPSVTVNESAEYAVGSVNFSNVTIDDVMLSITAIANTASSQDFELPVQYSIDGQLWLDGPAVSVVPGTERFYTRVKLINDQIVENTETCSVVVNVVSGSIQNTQASGLVTIIDDDRFPAISISSTSANEGSSAQFVVSLSRSSTSPVSVMYETVHGTTDSGDYTPTSGSLTFTPGVTEMTVTVPIIRDTTPEGIESFSVSLKNPVNGVIQAGTAQGSISANVPDSTASQLNLKFNFAISESTFFLVF